MSDPADESGWGVPAGEGGGRGLQEDWQGGGGEVPRGQGGGQGGLHLRAWGGGNFH